MRAETVAAARQAVLDQREQQEQKRQESRAQRKHELDLQRTQETETQRLRLQQKLDESARRKEQLVDKKKYGCLCLFIFLARLLEQRRETSRRASFNEDSLNNSFSSSTAGGLASHVPLEPIKFCTLCDTRLTTEQSLMSHLRAPSHLAAVAASIANDNDASGETTTTTTTAAAAAGAKNLVVPPLTFGSPGKVLLRMCCVCGFSDLQIGCRHRHRCLGTNACRWFCQPT
jgi:hypothetical protein